MSDTTFNIGRLGPGGGSGFRNSEHIEHLVAFVTPKPETRRGQSEDYDVAVCDYVICLTCKHAWTDVPVSGRWVVPRLTTSEAEIIPCTLVLGEATGGKNPPVIPEDATLEQQAEVLDVFHNFGGRLATGRLMFDVEKFHAESF
jgi:hypothetical protein